MYYIRLCVLVVCLSSCQALIQCSDGFISHEATVKSFYAGERQCKLENVIINGQFSAKNAKLSLKNVLIQRSMEIIGCSSVQVSGDLTVKLHAKLYCNRDTDSVMLPKSSMFNSLIFRGKSLRFYGHSETLEVQGAGSVNLEKGSNVKRFISKFAQHITMSYNHIGLGGASFQHAPEVFIRCSTVMGNIEFKHGYDHSPSIGCTERLMKVHGNVNIQKSKTGRPVKLFGISAPKSNVRLVGNLAKSLKITNVHAKTITVNDFSDMDVSKAEVEEITKIEGVGSTTVEDSMFNGGFSHSKSGSINLRRNTFKTFSYFAGVGKCDIKDNNNMKMVYYGNHKAEQLQLKNNIGGSIFLDKSSKLMNIENNNDMGIEIQGARQSNFVMKGNKGCVSTMRNNWGTFKVTGNKNSSLDFDTGGNSFELIKNYGQSFKLFRVSGSILMKENSYAEAACKQNSKFLPASTNNNFAKVDGWCRVGK